MRQFKFNEQTAIENMIKSNFVDKNNISKSLKNGLGFCFAHAFNYLLQLALLNLFIYIGIAAWLAPVPVYCIAIPTNFLIVRYVFRHAKT